MTSTLRLAALTVVAVVAYAGCSGPAGAPELAVSAKPRTITARPGDVAVIGVIATDANGKPGTGSVRLTSPVGTFKDGVEVPLLAGELEADFSCDGTQDPQCSGSVRITAEWLSGGKLAEGQTSVTITPYDAGAGGGGGTDAGSDAGTGGGGGTDGGTWDGGTYGDYFLTLDLEKPVLVRGTGDRMNLIATLTETATNQPVPNTTVTFTSAAGSFASSPGTMSTTATTDSAGVATTAIHVADALASFRVDAAALDATARNVVTVSQVNQVSWQDPGPPEQKTIAIQSTGSHFSTIVKFKVVDNSANPVPNVSITFRVKTGSAAGSACTSSGMSDSAGIAQTTLNSGNSPGPVTIEAVVTGTEVTGVPNSGVRGETGPYTVIVGRAYDGRLNVQCAEKSLGALETSTPPRNDLSTVCSATVLDRTGAGIPWGLTVQWFSEQGGVTPATSTPDNTNIARTTFRTGGNLPVDVAPIAGEPNYVASGTTRNPRDMFVTLIAAIGNGEEEFWDGSGTGAANGRWDPGEWYVDLPEPFVDANDNQRYDPGEVFVDTEPLNGRWDRPNGTWDTNTTIWRPAHVAYTGTLVGFGGAPGGATAPYLIFTPALPTVVPASSQASVNFAWFDAFFNRLSSNNSSLSIGVVAGTRGSATVTYSNAVGEAFGHDLVYETVRGTESAPDSGVFAIEGPCDFTLPDAGYPLTRCLRQYRFDNWGSSSIAGTITFTGAAPQPALPDGGPASPTSTTFELRGSNNLQSGPSTYQFTVPFQ